MSASATQGGHNKNQYSSQDRVRVIVRESILKEEENLQWEGFVKQVGFNRQWKSEELDRAQLLLQYS